MEMVSLKIGPSLRTIGEEWSLKDQTEIVLIRISHDINCTSRNRIPGIRSLQLLYLKDGELSFSDVIGDKSFGGPSFQEFKLDYPAEYITGMECYYYSNLLAALIIETNKNKYGPFGSPYMPISFSYKFGPENKFGGFHGIHDSSGMSSIGFYLNPPVFSPLLPAAGPGLCRACLRHVSDDNDNVDNQALKID